MQRKCLALLTLCLLGLGCRSGMVVAAEPGAVDPDVPEFTTTESGLRYRILRVGEGESPSITSVITVHSKGWLNDGTEFENTYEGEEPVRIAVMGLPAGWQEGLPQLREGGMMELEVPPSLAFGAEGLGELVPPNASTYHLIELFEVE